MIPHRRELRTCPVDGGTVLINSVLRATPVAAPAPAPRGEGWHPHDPPWVGIEGDTRVELAPAVVRDGLGAHEVIHGGLESALALAAERIADLRQDRRLRGFHVAGRADGGVTDRLELVALPFDHARSAPALWRDREIGGPRCLCVERDAVAILAWAPRTPMEVWVLPRHGRPAFGRDGGAVARLAAHALERLARALPGVGVDLVLVDGEPWRLELRPRLVTHGAFTLATGVPAHGSFPEDATAWLHDFC